MANYEQYDKLIMQMNKLDMQDDAIIQTRKIKDIGVSFCNIVTTEIMLK